MASIHKSRCPRLTLEVPRSQTQWDLVVYKIIITKTCHLLDNKAVCLPGKIDLGDSCMPKYYC